MVEQDFRKRRRVREHRGRVSRGHLVRHADAAVRRQREAASHRLNRRDSAGRIQVHQRHHAVSDLNDELPINVFDIVQFEPRNNDLLLDDLNGTTMRFRDGKFSKVERDSIVFNGTPIDKWPGESNAWKMVQSVKTSGSG